jgi:hypothetical protein
MDLDVTKLGIEAKYQELVDIWNLKLHLIGRIKGEIKIDEIRTIVWGEWSYRLKIKTNFGYRQLAFNQYYDLVEDFRFNKKCEMSGICLKYFSGVRTKEWKIKQYPKVHKGNISLYLNMKAGQKEGLCIQYHENGMPRIAAVYNKDKEFGEWREWDKERNLISSRFYYPEAIEIEQAKFYGYYKDPYKLPDWEYLCNPG